MGMGDVDLTTVADNAAKLWVEMEIGASRLDRLEALIVQVEAALGLVTA